jgi:hypothetical protein
LTKTDGGRREKHIRSALLIDALLIYLFFSLLYRPGFVSAFRFENEVNKRVAQPTAGVDWLIQSIQVSISSQRQLETTLKYIDVVVGMGGLVAIQS